MAKRQLVGTAVVFQELLEELVLLHCESVDEMEFFSNVFCSDCDCIKRKTLPSQGSENRCLKI